MRSPTLLFIAGLHKVWIYTDKLAQYQSQKGFRYTFKECSHQFYAVSPVPDATMRLLDKIPLSCSS